MIPRDYITAWRAEAPWVEDSQVEQDLVISRALVSIFSHPLLREAQAFRGGTALYKLHLRPATRYSEDIDLVQTRAEPAGPAMEALRGILDPWLGKPQWKQTEGRVTFVYRFDSEDTPPHPSAAESRDQFAGAFCGVRFQAGSIHCVVALVRRQVPDLQLRTRRAARDEVAGAVSAQAGSGPVRPGEGAGESGGQS